MNLDKIYEQSTEKRVYELPNAADQVRAQSSHARARASGCFWNRKTGLADKILERLDAKPAQVLEDADALPGFSA